MDAVSEITGLSCPEKTLAMQAGAEEHDINTIVERFGITGQLPDNIKLPQYGDYTQVPDYQTALNITIQAQEEFMKLPAKMRARFGNDPQAFLEFCGDPENREEARKMGILKPEPVTMGGTPIPPTAVDQKDAGKADKAAKD